MSRKFLSDEIAQRAASLIKARTTDMAEGVLKVPLDFYRSKSVGRREREAIFDIVPVPFVHVSEVRNPGDFVTKSFLGKPILVVRSEDGTVRVFENICRHRASKVCTEASGNGRRFSCRYHGWTYGDKGELVGIPGAEGFAGIDRATFGLTQLPSEERHGMIWIVRTPGAAIDVGDFLGQEADATLEKMEIAGRPVMKETAERPTELSLNFNWKAMICAFAENYHFATAHRDSMIGQIAVSNCSVFEKFGRHTMLVFPKKEAEALGDLPVSSWPHDVLSPVVYVYPCTLFGYSPSGVELFNMLPADDPEDVGTCRARLMFLGYPNEDIRNLMYDGVLNEDIRILSTMHDTHPVASHDCEVIGRNEIGVQTQLKTIASAIGYDLAGGTLR